MQRTQRILTLSVITLLVVVLLPLPLFAKGEDILQDHRLSPTQKEGIIDAIYGRMNQFSKVSGSPLEFDLGYFQHFERAEFDTLSLVDVMTHPGGDVIRIQRKVRSLKPTEQEWVAFEPSWEIGTDFYLDSENARAQGTAALSLEEVLGLARADDKDYFNTTSATSYQVTVSLDRKTRTYQALVLWTQEDTRQPVEFRIQDNVTERMDDVGREGGVAGGENDRQLAQAVATANTAPESIGPCCIPGGGAISQPIFKSKGNNHVYGKHKMTGSFITSCFCTRQCQNNCNSTVAAPVCKDTGLSILVHKTSSDTHSESNFFPGGRVTCRSAFACAVRFCLTTFCGVGVTVDTPLGGGGVTFSPPDTDIRWHEQGGGTCSSCPPDPTNSCQPIPYGPR